MPLSRRRALACFYCGSRTSHSVGTVRQFKCTNCEADNYLDQNGEITDPPVQSSATPIAQVRYVRSADRSPSPPPLSDWNDIFCQTCLKNQYLLKENLASYLPPDDHPQYNQYLDSYDDYRQKLEERYPQICGKCAPKARDRIKKATYLAKTDHLRRMMDRTRHLGPDRGMRGVLVRFLIRLAGIGYLGSALLQALWHGLMAASTTSSLSSMGLETDNDHYLTPQNSDASAASCLSKAYRERTINAACVIQCYHWISMVLIVALLTTWWNPQLLERYRRGTGAMTHIQQYYTLQLIVLASRAVGTYFLDPSQSIMDGDVLKGSHLFMAMFLLASLLVSARIIRLENKSTVSFQLSEAALLPNVSESDSSAASSFNVQQQVAKPPFSINALTTPVSFPSLTPRAYGIQGTLIEQNHDSDVMDWTPSHNVPTTIFNPPTRITRSAAKANPQLGPSPFRGTLPPAPIGPAHRMRNPPATAGAFRMASETQKNQFASSLRSATSAPVQGGWNQGMRGDDVGYDTDTTMGETEDERRGRMSVSTPKRGIELAPARFWPQGDLEKTGLEDIFEDGFNINDTPTEVTRRGRRNGKDIFQGQKSQATSDTNERWGGFGTRTNSDAEAEVEGNLKSDGWWSFLAILTVPVACFGIAFAVVKGGYL